MEFQVQPWKVREPHHPGEEVLAEEEAEDALQDEEDGVEAQGERPHLQLPTHARAEDSRACHLSLCLLQILLQVLQLELGHCLVTSRPYPHKLPRLLTKT